MNGKREKRNKIENVIGKIEEKNENDWKRQRKDQKCRKRRNMTKNE